MANEDKKTMKSRFEALKSEFGKIVWLDREKTGRQTAAVVIVSLILGVLIFLLDMLFGQATDFLVKL